MHLWKAIAATGIIVSVFAGCTRPHSASLSQVDGIQRGDSFALLTPAKSGTIGAARDAVVVDALTQHIGAAPDGKAARWQVEYSFAVRPANIGIVTDGNGMKQPVGLIRRVYLLDCKQTNYRMAIRIVDATNGAVAYQGSAEEQGCTNSAAEHQTTFARFVPDLVSAIKVQ